MLWLLLCPVHRRMLGDNKVPIVLIAIAMVLNDSGTLYGICTLSVLYVCMSYLYAPAVSLVRSVLFSPSLHIINGPKGRLF